MSDLMWTCPGCGKRVFNHYETCPDCGKERPPPPPEEKPEPLREAPQPLPGVVWPGP